MEDKVLSKRAQRELGGGVSQFAAILAKTRGRPDVVDLGQGFPDFLGCDLARQTASAAIDQDVLQNQYTAPIGMPTLREAVSKHYFKQYKATYDANSEVLITTSGTEAVFAAIQALVDEGDKVLVFEPFWPWYLPQIRMAGGDPVVVRLQPPSFLLDAQELERAFEQKPKVAVINSPQNPTGHVLTMAELETIGRLCVKHGVIALSDEVYENVVFGSAVHRRLADVAGMKERTLTIGSASKLFSVTGWRVGWLAGPASIIKGANVCHQHMSVCAPTPFQAGVAAALEAEDGSYDGVAHLYEGNYEILKSAFEKTGLATACAAEGGYFLVVDVSPSGLDDLEFCSRLIDVAGVAGMPMRSFYTPDIEGKVSVTNLVRYAICKSRAAIERAAKALKNVRNLDPPVGN